MFDLSQYVFVLTDILILLDNDSHFCSVPCNALCVVCACVCASVCVCVCVCVCVHKHKCTFACVCVSVRECTVLVLQIFERRLLHGCQKFSLFAVLFFLRIIGRILQKMIM